MFLHLFIFLIIHIKGTVVVKGDNPIILNNVTQFISVINGNNTFGEVYRFPTTTKFSLVSLGFPRSKVRFRFKPLESNMTQDKFKCMIDNMVDMSFVIMSGCTGPTAELEAEVYSESVNFTVAEDPLKDCGVRSSAAYLNGEIVLCGGDSPGETRCFSTVPGTDTWKDFPNIQEERRFFSMDGTANFIAVVGGAADADKSKVVKVWNKESWIDGPIMEEFRGKDYPAVIGLDNDMIMVTGGGPFSLAGLADVFLVDLKTSGVVRAPSLKRARQRHAITTYVIGTEKYVVVAGGLNRRPLSNVEMIRVCDADRNIAIGEEWKQLARTNTARFNTALGVYGSTLVAVGGSAIGSGAARFEAYDPVDDVWKLTGAELKKPGRRSFAYLSFKYEI